MQPRPGTAQINKQILKINKDPEFNTIAMVMLFNIFHILEKYK